MHSPIMTTILSGDPGLTGALALVRFDGDAPVSQQYWRMPTRPNWAGNGRIVDVLGLVDIINDQIPACPDVVIIEQQQIRRGQRGALTIGTNYGRILAMIEYLLLPAPGESRRIVTVHPRTWTAAFGLDNGDKDKEQHIRVARKYGAELPGWSKAYLHGAADAFLMAYYARGEG